MGFEFASAFEALTGHPPFGWQARLFADIVAGCDYDACDIPTGLGKTSIIPIWLLALAQQASAGDPGAVTLPRRLVYVVDRRTVVDQATEDAEAIRRRLREPPSESARAVAAALATLCVRPQDPASPLAISTLRGEFADNREWQADPARAAVIVGTVDMIGSRLLFCGYGAGRSSRRALSAGLLGQDALLVHDEAHLSQPFGALVREIARVQAQAGEPRPLRVLEMSATRPAGSAPAAVFALNSDEESEDAVARRLNARKALHLSSVADRAGLPARLAEAALSRGNADGAARRVLVFCQTVDEAKETFWAIERRAGKGRAALLTGTLRGHERDRLTQGEIFAAFKADPARAAVAEDLYLVATAAGEVGVNLDADHMVCDLAPLDSMIQRLGRVNRLGRDGDFVAQVEVVEAPAAKAKEAESARASAREERQRRTRDALLQLPALADGGRDASPRALRERLKAMTDEGTLAQAFAPKAEIAPLTDILLDNWALTTRRDLPGRPPVADWLHGIRSEPPETIVVWREEAAALAALLDDDPDREDDVEEWFDRHRIAAREKVSEPTARVAGYFRALARRHDKDDLAPRALLFTPRGGLRSVELADLAEAEVIANATVILPSAAGGLVDGMLKEALDPVADVADVTEPAAPLKEVARFRVLIRKPKEEDWQFGVLGMGCDALRQEVAAAIPEDAGSVDAIVQMLLKVMKSAQRENPFVERERVVVARDGDTGAVTALLVAFGRAQSAETALAASTPSPGDRSLADHLADARHYAVRLVAKLGRLPEIAPAVVEAAACHDTGKDRIAWQKSIYNSPPRDPAKRQAWRALAKTAHGRTDRSACPGYRHEFGSLNDLGRQGQCEPGSPADIARHLVAAHHGRARPHFPPRECVDPGDHVCDLDIEEAAAETLRRYARMQRRFGRWGVAWIEALLKAVDVLATTHVPEAASTPAESEAAA